MELPRGKKMPISPMTNSNADKGLSQETPKAMSEKDGEGGEAASAVICTGEEEGKDEAEEGRKATIRRGVEGPTKKEREAG